MFGVRITNIRTSIILIIVVIVQSCTHGVNEFDIDRLEKARTSYDLALELYKNEEYVHASTLYSEVLQVYPSNEIRFKLAQAYAFSGEIDKAVETLQIMASTRFLNKESLQNKKELKSLIDSEIWQTLMEKIDQNQAEHADKYKYPKNIKFITTDIDHFWQAFDLSKEATTHEERMEIFKRHYFNIGSIGLRDFFWKKIRSIDLFVTQIENSKSYFEGIRNGTKDFSHLNISILKGFNNLQELYKMDVVFNDVYFVIGRLTSSGTVSENGMLIGMESFILEDTPLEEIDKSRRLGLKPLSLMPHTVIHEFTHQLQHQAGAPILLRAALFEGSADFVAELAIGEFEPRKYYQRYGDMHEEEVWTKFKVDMNGTNTSNWIANNDKATVDWPADLGYYMGYRIAKDYYKNADDKPSALNDLLTVEDGLHILEKSRYSLKFNK